MATSITSIKGISPERAEILGRVGITTVSELAASSPEVVRDSFVGSRHRIGLPTAGEWVAAAGAMEAETWHRAASFVVTFEERIERGQHHRRTVVEQTEVDTDPAPTETWSGWDCSQVCDWMQDLFELRPSSGSVGREPAAEGGAGAGGGEQERAVEREQRPASSRRENAHHIVDAVLIGAAGERVVLAADGEAAAGDIPGLARPEKLVVTVERAAGRRALVAGRFRDLASGAATLAGPVELPAGSSNVTLDTRWLRSGRYGLVVVAWDDDEGVSPHSIVVSKIVVNDAEST